MAPKVPIPTAASDRSLRTTSGPANPSQTEGIQNPLGRTEDSASPNTQTLREEAAAASKRLKDQLDAQSQEIAELRAILLQQLRPPSQGSETRLRPTFPPESANARGKRPVHHYPYGLEPDDLLDSVEDVEDAPHFARHSITPASRHPNSY
jgi:hypothetical protein